MSSRPDPFHPEPPRIDLRPAETVLHGTTIVDPYAWLKAENWRDVLKDGRALPAEIRAVLDAENAYADAVLGGTVDLRAKLVGEMRGRMVEDDASVPDPDGPWAYYTRHREGGQNPLVCRKPREGGDESILLDGDKEAGNRSYFDLGGTRHSPDHALLAWGADTAGSELHTIRVRDLATGEDLADEIVATTAEFVWAADSRMFWYVEVDEEHRPVRVRRHRIGDPQAQDAIVFEETESGWFVDIDETSSGRFATISVSDHETSEVRLLDRHNPDAPPRLVAPRQTGVLYGVEHRPDTDELVISTDADGAVDFKLVLAPVADPARHNWRDFVPYRPGTTILRHTLLAGHLVRVERENANPRLVVTDLASGDEHVVSFPEEAYSLFLETGYEFDTRRIRFVYSSMTTPSETYDYDLVTRERTLLKRQDVPSGFDPALYETRRIQATAPDGESVPVSLVRRRDSPLDGTAPCLLYGYGSYGTSLPAAFRTNLFSLVDRGFTYAIAHVRGGSEKGRQWYLDGKREKKPNSFSDFIACADALIDEGYTGRGRIVGMGGSAGGMLMGAVANLGGDRFAGIVADVPFVDVMNTMLDGDLPLTPPEWPEWGNPATDEAAFRAILSYSPYDNVAAQSYPAILALGGLTDPRVTYWEPAKWVARLRATLTGGGPILLKTNMDAGHGGASGRFDRLDEVALIYAFALKAVEGSLAGAGRAAA